MVYKRISTAGSEAELNEIRTELEDTCGFIPAEVDNLLEVITIRNMLKSVLGKKLEYDGSQVTISFHQQSTVDPAKIIRLTQKKVRRAKFTPDLKLQVPVPGLDSARIIEETKVLLGELIN